MVAPENMSIVGAADAATGFSSNTLGYITTQYQDLGGEH